LRFDTVSIPTTITFDMTPTPPPSPNPGPAGKYLERRRSRPTYNHSALVQKTTESAIAPPKRGKRTVGEKLEKIRRTKEGKIKKKGKENEEMKKKMDEIKKRMEEIKKEKVEMEKRKELERRKKEEEIERRRKEEIEKWRRREAELPSPTKRVSRSHPEPTYLQQHLQQHLQHLQPNLQPHLQPHLQQHLQQHFQHLQQTVHWHQQPGQIGQKRKKEE
jgi:hypothetical protein